MDFIAFVEEKFGKIRAVLAGDASDEGAFHFSLSRLKSEKGEKSKRH